jgi:hypothetical protein
VLDGIVTVPAKTDSTVTPRASATTTASLMAAAAHDPEETIHHWSPKKVVSTYVDPSGVRHLTVLFALTGGVITTDNSGVSVKVTDNGFELSLSEKFPSYQLEMEAYYHHFPRDPRESDDQFNARKLAMMDTVRKMRAYGLDGALTSIYRYKLPFRVDPVEMNVTYTGTSDGCRVAHVDLCERRKVKLHCKPKEIGRFQCWISHH